MSTLGGVQYSGDIMSTPWGYHDKWGKVIGKTIEFVWKTQCTEIPRCTHGIPHTHHGIPQCTYGIPPVYSDTPGVLNDIPPVY